MHFWRTRSRVPWLFDFREWYSNYKQQDRNDFEGFATGHQQEAVFIFVFYELL
jgi:hypothetical protein